MFFAPIILTRKGPLAKVWLAAHWEKKLTKAQIYDTDVSQAVDEVMKPKVKMALRTVGHLLLGIVRIYSKKARYLLADTNEAYVKMRVNFRDGFTFETELPVNREIDEDFPEGPVAGDFNITVPEFLDADYNEQLILANQARLEDITLREDVNYDFRIQIDGDAEVDDGFGDVGGLEQLHDLYGSIQLSSARPTPQPESMASMMDVGGVEQPRDVPLVVEGARDGTIDLSGVTAKGDVTTLLEAEPQRPLDLDYGIIKQEPKHAPELDFDFDFDPQAPAELYNSMAQPAVNQPEPASYLDDPGNFGFEPEAESSPVGRRSPESFALEPIVDQQNLEVRKKRQRKPRKLIVDEETIISNEAFREQQEDFTDLLKALNLAPPTRQSYKLCRTGELPYLMRQMGSEIGNRDILGGYRQCLKTRKYDANFTMAELSGDGSSLATPNSEAEPWEDLELNEHVVEHDLNGAATGGHAADVVDFFDDFDMGENFAPLDAMEPPNFDRTLEAPRHDDDVEFDAPMMPVPVRPDENKENEDDDWSDPFSMSTRSRGRLEAYGFGAVMTPNSTTTQMSAEDEGKWAKRAKYILKKVAARIETSSSGHAEFSAITARAETRKQAAEQFYSLLTLAKAQTIVVEQTEPFGEILVRAGDKFQEAMQQQPSLRTPMRPVQQPTVHEED